VTSSFTLPFTASAADIDELGHVNNAVWVRWVQDIATAHWMAIATPEQVAAYVWVIVRHEIDYQGNIGADEHVTGSTWVSEPPVGARFNRHVKFIGADGKVKVNSLTTWALIDRTTGRLLRVRDDVTERFLCG
jgi:acyl-CoA thioester hydrolase